MVTQVSCYDCGNKYALEKRKRCECGEPLWMELMSTFTSNTDAYGVDRYADQLPVDEPVGVGAGAGGTPIIRVTNLDNFAGCRFHVKDECENPTGSFKDRGSAVGVAYALNRGRDHVGTVSHGNMAMSMSAHSAGTDADCIVLVPSRIPPERLEFIAQYGSELVQVKGDYGYLYYKTLDAGLEHEVEFVNSDTPLRIEGQKTIAYELYETFGRTIDGVVLPVSSGGHASAIWKGFRELKRASAIDTVPPLYLVQASACDPIAQAHQAGDAEVMPVDPSGTIAFSIANGSPPSGNRALTAAHETGGTVVSVPDNEIRGATNRLAHQAGLCVEPASATTLAGLRRLTGAGAVDESDNIIAIVTGTGFKEFGSQVEVDTTTVEATNLEQEMNRVLN